MSPVLRATMAQSDLTTVAGPAATLESGRGLAGRPARASRAYADGSPAYRFSFAQGTLTVN